MVTEELGQLLLSATGYCVAGVTLSDISCEVGIEAADEVEAPGARNTTTAFGGPGVFREFFPAQGGDVDRGRGRTDEEFRGETGDGQTREDQGAQDGDREGKKPEDDVAERS